MILIINFFFIKKRFKKKKGKDLKGKSLVICIFRE